MIRLRKECPEIGWGDWKILAAGSPHVLAHRYDWRGSSLLILHNFSARPQEARFQVEGEGPLINLLDNEEIARDGNGTCRLTLEGHGYRWYRIGGLARILRREKV